MLHFVYPYSDPNKYKQSIYSACPNQSNNWAKKRIQKIRSQCLLFTCIALIRVTITVQNRGILAHITCKHTRPYNSKMFFLRQGFLLCTSTTECLLKSRWKWLPCKWMGLRWGPICYCCWFKGKQHVIDHSRMYSSWAWCEFLPKHNFV